ncbi:MAG: flagellar motor switch protein FliN [Betaproteobacteria bacterium TMED82]|nr:MAG: flagellar motor switch protein FliN [Betaproteobacteria bacterium TMED82]|tara:strand:- start:55193 stop:55558 length:366 start_codon:yes stop_codon:yes gene_type:complete
MAEEEIEEQDKTESNEENDSQGGEIVEASTEENKVGKINPEVLQGIPVTISVEVGRTSLKIRDLLRLAQGSVVELERLAGEPLDLLVNNTVVAQGEIVLVNDRYGIRLTRVVPAEERMKSL